MWYIPKACNPGPRLCPKPELIEKYVKDKIGFEGHIGEQDKMCIPCYRSHLAFLHEEKFDSTDSDLRQLVNSFTQQISTYDAITNLDDLLNAAIIKTTVWDKSCSKPMQFYYLRCVIPSLAIC